MKRLGVLLVLLGLAAGAARAADPPPIQLSCRANTVFSPKLPAALRVADIVGPITSSAPSIVYAYPDRAGGGSVGEVTLVAQGHTGDAVVTYDVQNRFTGASATFRLVIHVTCPVPPDGPPPPPPPPTVNDGPQSAWPHPAHVSTTCKVCRSVATDINGTIDYYNQQVSAGASPVWLQSVLKSIGEAQLHLRDCEKLCLKPPSVRDPHPPPPPAPPPPANASRRWPHPVYASTDCVVCRSIARDLNDTIDEFNREVSDGVSPARLQMILTSIGIAREHLAGCERSCHASQAGQSVKGASVVSGSVEQSIGVTAPPLAKPNTTDVPAAGGAASPP